MAINQAIEKYHKLRDKPIYHFNTMWRHEVGMELYEQQRPLNLQLEIFHFISAIRIVYGALRGLLDIYYEPESQK